MYEFMDYQVEDVMTSEVTTTKPETPLCEVEAIFEARDFNSLPVLNEAGLLVGVVTKLDLLGAFRFNEDHMFPPYADIMKTPVGEVMTRDPKTVTPRTRLTGVLEKLVESAVKSFPVVDGHELVGVVSREDVLGALRRASQAARPNEA
jgi:CBS domain-containing protein